MLSVEESRVFYLCKFAAAVKEYCFILAGIALDTKFAN